MLDSESRLLVAILSLLAVPGRVKSVAAFLIHGIVFLGPEMEVPIPDPAVSLTLVVFTLSGCRYGLPVEAVRSVRRMVLVVPLPGAPAIVLGLINVAGAVVPVIDLRRRFSLPETAIALSDRLILARTPRRTVALRVDEVQPAVSVPLGAEVPAARVLPGLAHVRGVVAFEDGLVLIQDLEAVLSLDEEDRLDTLLAAGAACGTDVPTT